MLAHHPAAWIRHGDLADGANQYRMLAAAPTLVTEGIPVPPLHRNGSATLDITTSAAGAHSCTVVVYGYKPEVLIDAGGFAAIAGANGPGWTNIGEIAIASAAGAQSRSAHQLQGVSAFTRLYARATLLVGAPSIWGDFGFSPHDAAKE